MPNITIFTIPKAFQGNTAVIQNNAIKSWLRLDPKPEVILFGDDEGIAEKALELGTKHIPNINKNEFGTPLIDYVFRKAQEISGNEIICFVNSDIILLSDFISSIGMVTMRMFLLVGQRWDLDLTGAINFSNPEWEKGLRSMVSEQGKLHSKSGMDYFVFPVGMFYDIPPFAIGRTTWDNWLAYRARKLGFPLIDGTETITAIHQNHNYTNNKEGVWQGAEARKNQQLGGGSSRAFTTEHANKRLLVNKLQPAMSLRHLYFRLSSIPVTHPKLGFLESPFKILTNSIIQARRMTR